MTINSSDRNDKETIIIIEHCQLTERHINVNEQKRKITVFYDGACPSCVQDRRLYQRLAGQGDKEIVWFDINNQDEHLRNLGITPQKALTELHVQLAGGKILSELDAYICLMQRIWLLIPIAWLIFFTNNPPLSS